MTKTHLALLHLPQAQASLLFTCHPPAYPLLKAEAETHPGCISEV